MAKAAKKAGQKSAKSAKKTASKSASKSASKAPKKAAAKTAKKSSGRKAGGAANSAFMAPVNLSPQLAEIVGKDSMPRTEVVKKIWDYIKSKDLQDKKNRRMINADEKLKTIFKKDQVSMFDLAKIVNNNVKK
jgi:chromatin remodeling complex protein RSC6